jgi:hypothetical protein
MAPYLGLLGDGREIEWRGYVRKDLSAVRWRISPKDDTSLVVLNFDGIAWEWAEPIHPVPMFAEVMIDRVAIYSDVTGDEMLTSSPVGPHLMAGGDSLTLPPGSLRFDHEFTNEDTNTKLKESTSDREVKIDILKRALERIADSPKMTSAEAMRQIARRTLERMEL